MANTLRFKRGLASGLPTGVAGEPLFTTDTFDLYIGTGAANQRYQKYIASGTTLQYLRGDGSLATFPTNIITGTGTTNYLPKFTGASALGNSVIFEGTRALGFNTATPVDFGSGTYNFHLHDAGIPVLQFTNTTTGQSSSVGMRLQANGNDLLFINSQATGVMRWNTNGAERMRLDASGNLGLGVTPSAWSGTNGFQLGYVGSLNGRPSGSGIYLSSNVYFVGDPGATGANARYIQSTTAGSYSIIGNNHYWFTAPSGTLNTAITWTRPMTLTANGRLLLGSTSEGTQTLQVTGDTLVSGNTASYIAQLNQANTTAGASFGTIIRGGTNVSDSALRIQNAAQTLNLLTIQGNGSLGLGTTLLTGYNFRINKTITGSAVAYGIDIDSAIQSDVNNAAVIYGTSVGTQVASFTLGSLYHYNATQGTFGAGSAVTSQFGFRVSSNMTGATNNYAYYGEIASGTGRWNLFMNGTAANFFNGSLGIGTTTLTGFSLRINKAITGSIESYGISQQGPVLNDVTTVAVGIDNALVLNAGAICSAYNHFRARVQFYSATSFGTQIGFLANNTLTQATNNYGFYGDIASGTGRWNLYMNGTADNFISGNTQIGTGAFTSEKLQVNGTMKVTGAATFSSSVTAGGNLLLTNGGAASIGAINLIRTGTSPVASRLTFGTDGTGYSFAIGKNQAGSVTDLVSILDSGAATFSSTITSTQTNGFTIGGLINVARIQYGSDAATSFSLLTAANAFAGLYASSAVFSSSVTATAMTLTTAGGQLKLKDSANEGFVGVSGTSMYFTDFATAAKGLIVNISTGAANFSSSIQAATAIAIGTTPDTNKPFKILKNINATVGINFENTSTSSLAFSAIQMGTDVTGGTKFTNLVYGSSGISQTGVYHPDGTSLINNGGGGLNFLGTPTRFYTGGSNGVVRLYLDNNGLTQLNATSPTTSETDGYRQYSADVVAGNAAPHFRTENGAVIKLYQETTAVGNSTISVGGGSAVLDDTQFGGYTLRQVVQALRNQGILA